MYFASRTPIKRELLSKNNGNYESRVFNIELSWRGASALMSNVKTRPFAKFYRHVGISAGRRLQSVINSVETSWSLWPSRKAVLASQTPIRRHADTRHCRTGRTPL